MILTILALWLQYLNKLTYLLTIPYASVCAQLITKRIPARGQAVTQLVVSMANIGRRHRVVNRSPFDRPSSTRASLLRRRQATVPKWTTDGQTDKPNRVRRGTHLSPRRVISGDRGNHGAFFSQHFCLLAEWSSTLEFIICQSSLTAFGIRSFVLTA